jgi:FXSXX-COOH protein
MKLIQESRGADVESELPDLFGRSVLELSAVPEDEVPALAHALRRLRAEAEQPGEVLAGWNSAI